jgi:hypothetical protein
MKVIGICPGGTVVHMILMSRSRKKGELFLYETVQVKHNPLRNLANLLKSVKIFILNLLKSYSWSTEFS